MSFYTHLLSEHLGFPAAASKPTQPKAVSDGNGEVWLSVEQAGEILGASPLVMSELARPDCHKVYGVPKLRPYRGQFRGSQLLRWIDKVTAGREPSVLAMMHKQRQTPAPTKES